MIRYFLSTMVVLTLSLWVSTANAVLTISNVSYTSNSVTFTIDGDMTGYESPNINKDQFSLVYGGDIWVGDQNFEPNSWSRSVFDNKSFKLDGNTGTSGNNYTWSEYLTDLTDAVVDNATITVTFTEPDLDEQASSPVITFVWGNGSNANNYTVLASTGDFDSTPTEPVPTLSGWALILFSMLLALVVLSRRKHLF